MKVFKGSRPEFNSPLLRELMIAVAGRSKAIAKQVASVQFERDVLPHTDGQIEILDIYIATSPSNAALIHVSAYSDRRIVVRFSSGGKNPPPSVKLKTTIDYRPPSDTVVCLEETAAIARSHFSGEALVEALDRVWSRLSDAKVTIAGKRLSAEEWG